MTPEALTLVLVGPMGAGKTSVGRRVARTLAVPFIDTDRRIVAEHGPIPELFSSRGEDEFRRIEREIVAEVLAEGGVISLGGGAVTQAETRLLLRDVPVVLLSVSAEAVADRIRTGGRPLLAGGDDPVQRWQRIFDDRRAWYDEVADVEFDTSRRPMARIAEEITTWRKEQA